MRASRVRRVHGASRLRARLDKSVMAAISPPCPALYVVLTAFIPEIAASMVRTAHALPQFGRMGAHTVKSLEYTPES
jgi:hypothetical protein